MHKISKSSKNVFALVLCVFFGLGLCFISGCIEGAIFGASSGILFGTWAVYENNKDENNSETPSGSTFSTLHNISSPSGTRTDIEKKSGVSDDQGIMVASCTELGKDIEIHVKDSNGDPIPDVEVEWCFSNGRLCLFIFDPSGTYSPFLYEGDPLLAPESSILAKSAGNSKRGSVEPRIVLMTTCLLISVALIAYSEYKIIRNTYEIQKFEMENLAHVSENYIWLKCKIKEIPGLMRSKFGNRMAVISIALSFATAGLAGGAGVEAAGTAVDLGLAADTEILEIIYDGVNQVWAQNAGPETAVYIRESNTKLDRLFGVVEIFPLTVDDPFEPNNTSGTAAEITRTEEYSLVILGTDEDWFKMYANPGDTIWTEIKFDHLHGNLNLELYDPNGVKIDQSNSLSNSERVVVNNVSTPGEYHIRAFQQGGEEKANIYDIKFSSVGGEVIGSRRFRVVLSWDENPEDLDAHLITPSIGGLQYHIYFANKYSGSIDTVPYAELDVDDRDSYGPETITIHQLQSGTYHYFVNHYSGSGNLTTSGAMVKVYTENVLYRSFSAPTTGSPVDDWNWHVFQIDGDTGTITLVNTYSPDLPVAKARIPSINKK